MPPPTWHGVGRQFRAPAWLFPSPMAASRSMTWTSGYLEKRSTHSWKLSNSSALLAALHELDDFAAHQVDGRNQHGQPHGNACSARSCCLRSTSALDAVSERWRRRERRRRGLRGRPRRNVRRRPHHRRRSPGCGRRQQQLRVRAQSKPDAVPSRSMEVSRISPAPRVSASCAHAMASVPWRATTSAGERLPVWLGALVRLASMATMTACEPKRSAMRVIKTWIGERGGVDAHSCRRRRRRLQPHLRACECLHRR